MKVVRLVTLMALSAGVTSAAFAQQAGHQDTTVRHASRKANTSRSGKQKAHKENLSALAKVTLDSATKVALARVPGGVVKKHELEREEGKVIYSFDITAPGKPGVEEVWVSAIDGSVVKQEHESAAKEKSEAAAEKKKKKGNAK